MIRRALARRISTVRALVSGDRGEGLVITVAGMVVFLVLLFAACQILLGLYARSTTNAAAFDAARIASGDAGSEDAAESHVHSLLGSNVQTVTVDKDVPGDGGAHSTTTVTVTVEAPGISWHDGALRIGEITQTATVTDEAFRDWDS